MSLLNDASLVMIPSGYKDTKLYSVKPTDGSGDFTFSRGSNLAATRVNSEGLIEKGRENLLLQSNSFDTTWGSVNTTETSGQTGYDGSSDAWLLSITASGAYLYQDKAETGVQTFSFYAKEGTLPRVNVLINASVNVTSQFDLANGIVLAGSNSITSSIESIGNGWYRCSVTYNQGTTSRFRLYPVEAAGGGTSGSIYIQDAQLELGLVATDYIETTTTTEQAGILEDMPRLDYSGGGCPSLLLEPQRTNLDTQSEYIAGWNGFSNLTRTANYAESPEGVDNATRLEFTGNGYTYNGNTPSQVSGSTYTMSCYAKRNDSGTQNFGFFVDGSGAVNSEMTLTSEWQRFTYTYTASNTSRQGLAGISGADVSVYGFQIEKDASYPTSYIPTYGASVTRSADKPYIDNLVTNGIVSASGLTWAIKLNNNTEIIRGVTDRGFFISTTDAGVSNGINVRRLDSGLSRAQVTISEGGSTARVYDTTADTSALVIRTDGSTMDVWENGEHVVISRSVTLDTSLMEYQTCRTSEETYMLLSKNYIFGLLTDSECASISNLM